MILLDHPALVVMIVGMLILAVVLLIVFGWATWVESEEKRIREMTAQRFYRDGLRERDVTREDTNA